MSKFVKDRIIVLARTDFGEKDRILSVLGRDHGKASIIAKAVRSPKSKLAGSVELLCETDIQYVLGRNNLHTLTGARVYQSYVKLSDDIDRTLLAYDFLKLLNKTIEEGHGQEYYGILSNAFSALAQKNKNIDLIKTWFGIRVLYESGHTPELKNDSTGKALSESKGYNYNYDSQCFTVSSQGRFTAEDIKLLRVLVRARNVPNVQANELSLKRTAKLVDQIVQLQLY